MSGASYESPFAKRGAATSPNGFIILALPATAQIQPSNQLFTLDLDELNWYYQIW
jgi:hypothetical protein